MLMVKQKCPETLGWIEKFIRTELLTNRPKNHASVL